MPSLSSSPSANVTPYQIVLAAFMAFHSEADSPLYSVASSSSAHDFDQVNDILHDLLLHTGSTRNSDNNAESISYLRTKLPPLFFEYLGPASSSIDAFLDLIYTLQQSLRSGTVDPSSQQGIFLRTVALELDSLEFDQVVAVFDDFVQQLQSTDEEDEPAHSISKPPQEEDKNDEDPSRHLLKFQDYLDQGERVQAVHALHQYMVEASEEILPFCSIVLCAMHHPTHPQLVQQAAEEAVRVAQQSQDTACVAFALGWLAHHHSSNNHNSHQASMNRKLMERCVSRATEDNLHTLAQGARLRLTLQALQEPQSSMKDAWDAWRDATAEAPTDETSWGPHRPTRLTESRQRTVRPQMVAARIWDTTGAVDLAAVAGVTALQQQELDSTPEDLQSVIQNLSRAVLFGANAWKSARGVREGNMKQAMADTEDLRPGDKTAATKCIYANALSSIVDLRRAYQVALPARKYIVDVGLIALEWAIRRGDTSQAEGLWRSLQGQIYSITPVVLDLEQQHCFLLTRQGKWTQAIHALRSLVETAEPTKKAELLFQLVCVHLGSNAKLYSEAIKPLEECLQLAQDHELDALHASALVALAQIHIRMGDCDRAIALVRSVLPTVLQSAHVWVQAEAYRTLSQALLKKRRTKAALRALTQSQLLFEMCHDFVRLREVFYHQAHIYDQLEDTTLRNRAAEQFVRMSQYIDRASSEHSNKYIRALQSPDDTLKLVNETGFAHQTEQQ